MDNKLTAKIKCEANTKPSLVNLDLVKQLNKLDSLNKQPLPDIINNTDLNAEQKKHYSPKLPKNSLKQDICEFVPNLSAATLGAISFGLINSVETDGLSLIAYPVAAGIGAVTNYGLKDGLEHLLLPAKQAKITSSDWLWGALSGLSGVACGLVDEEFMRSYSLSLGRNALGPMANSDEVNFASQQIIKDSLAAKLKLNTLRGFVGGGVGSFSYTLPYELINNWSQVKRRPLSTLLKINENVCFNSVLGGLTGGVLGLGVSSLVNSGKIANALAEKISPKSDLTQVNYFHINDFHSSLEQLPGIKTALDESTQKAQAKSIPTRFVVAGDVESGNLNFTFTNGGQVENSALAKMGADTIIPGNHPYDIPGGGYNVDRYPQVIKPILEAHPKLNLLSANLDLNAYPDYENLTRPYVVHEVTTPHGIEKIAEIGLTTEEGAVNKIGYQDAKQVAVKYINELNSQGINKIVLVTHLGLSEDTDLAQYLNSKNLKVAAIIGGHSHDITPLPVWVTNDDNSIPIVQAGSKGRWLGQLSLVINKDGSANSGLTDEKLIPVTQDTEPNLSIKEFVNNSIASANALKQETYGTILDKPIELSGIRFQETPLGNLAADSLFDYVSKNTNENLDFAFVNSGGIREGLPANQELSRFDLAKVFINSGVKEEELHEMLAMDLTGAQIKQILEYGVRDIPNPQRITYTQRLANMFKTSHSLDNFDASGNFVHTSGLRYKINLSDTPMTKENLMGNRISQMLKYNDGSNPVAVEPGKTYRVLTRFHPLEKWMHFGIFGDTTLKDLSSQANISLIHLSQVDSLANYIQGLGKISTEMLAGCDHRINYDTNPKLMESYINRVHIGQSIIAIPTIATLENNNNNNNK